MTFIVKGFINDSGFIDNSPNASANVFELSSKGMTYAKDKQYYSLPAYPTSDLIVFKSLDTTNGTNPAVEASVVDIALILAQLIKSYPSTHTGPFSSSDYRGFLETNAPAGVTGVSIGSFELHNGAEYPKWYTFSTSTSDVKIYISNSSFLADYDEFEIVVVPPLNNTLEFNDTYPNVLNKLALVTPDTFNDRIEQAKDIHPNTYTKVLEFWYHNKFSPTIKTKTYWAVIIYGEAGNDIDTIKTAIEEHILLDPGNDVLDWELMFPDIFNREEYLLMPMWHKVSIENLTVLSNLYSSMLVPSETVSFLHTEYNDLYSEVAIYDNLIMFPYDYKGITISALPSGADTSSKPKLFEIFPDYVPIDTSSLDYMRMSPNTREWMLKLQIALMTTETLNTSAPAPSGFKKLTRGTRKYLSFYYGNVNYLVAYRHNAMYTAAPVTP